MRGILTRQRRLEHGRISAAAGERSRTRALKGRVFLAFAGIFALVLGIGSGAAYAYWTSHGTGSGTASTGIARSVTVQAASGTLSSELVPGGTSDLLVQLNNPNTYSVTIVGIAQNGAPTPVGGAGCTSANSGVSVPTQAGLNITVGTGTQLVHIPNGASMDLSSASGCQGASFHLPVTVTVQR
jgi:hypothetical protein